MYEVIVVGNLEIITKWIIEDRAEALKKARRLTKTLRDNKRDATVCVWNLNPINLIYDQVTGNPQKIEGTYGWGSSVGGPRREGNRREIYTCVPVALLEKTRRDFPWMIGPMSGTMRQAQGL